MRLKRLILAGLAGVLSVPGWLAAAPPPETRDVTVTATVCNETITEPTITSPANFTISTESIITVSGTAGPNQNITVTRNGVLAGSVTADGTGRWDLPVTLQVGYNVLVATNCKPSNPVTVEYVPPVPPPPPPPPPPPTPGPPSSPDPASSVPGAPPGRGVTPQFVFASTLAPIVLDQSRPGQAPPAVRNLPANSLVIIPGTGPITMFTRQTAELPFRIQGGAPPYRVTVRTGDGGLLEEVHRTNLLTALYRYDKPGRFRWNVEVEDAVGRRAQAETTVLVLDRPLAVSQQHPVPGWTLLLILLLEFLLIVLGFTLWEYHLHKPKQTHD